MDVFHKNAHRVQNYLFLHRDIIHKDKAEQLELLLLKLPIEEEQMDQEKERKPGERGGRWKVLGLKKEGDMLVVHKCL